MVTANTTRRWFQYRLASLFALVFAVSVLLAIHAHRERQYRLRVAAAEVLAKEAAFYVERSGGGAGSFRQLRSYDGTLLRDEAAVRAYCFSGEEFSALTLFPELKGLKCDNDSIVSDSQLAEVGKLPSLERLELAKTGIGDNGVRHLGSLRLMHTLDLSGNPRITGATMQFLTSMQQLQELNLSGTSVDDEGVRHIAALQSLRILNLSGARVTDEGVRHLGSLTQLASLLLEGNDISDDILPGLARLPKLSVLTLGSRRITDEGLSVLACSDSIRNLTVSGCAISDAGLVSLARMKCLRSVSARNTAVTANGIAELKRLKPKAGPLDEAGLAFYAIWGFDAEKAQDEEIEVSWDDPAKKHDNEGEPRQAGAAGSGFF